MRRTFRETIPFVRGAAAAILWAVLAVSGCAIWDGSDSDPHVRSSPSTAPDLPANAVKLLAGLRVTDRRHPDDYDRDAFGSAWSDTDGNGCYQKSTRATFDVGPSVWDDPGLAGLVEEMTNIEHLVALDPRVDEVMPGWTGCMAEAGYHGLLEPYAAQDLVSTEIAKVAGDEGKIPASELEDFVARLAEEEAVLDELDPPLNLQGMAPSPVRRRLKELRKRYSER